MNMVRNFGTLENCRSFLSMQNGKIFRMLLTKQKRHVPIVDLLQRTIFLMSGKWLESVLEENGKK